MSPVIECMKCGRRGPTTDTAVWCECGHRTEYELCEPMCSDSDEPPTMGFVRHLGGQYRVVAPNPEQREHPQ